MRVVNLPWVAVIASLLGGGAVGAVITALVTSHRNRIQPVKYRLELNELFASVATGPSTSVQVLLNDKGAVFTFSGLQQLMLNITNAGNADLEKFRFSLSFPPGTKVVLVEANDADRNHKFIAKPEISPGHPVDVLDFEVEPFNRRDVYDVIAYIADAQTLDIWDVRFTSPAPVTFNYSPSTAELVSTRAAPMAEQLVSAVIGAMRIRF